MLAMGEEGNSTMCLHERTTVLAPVYSANTVLIREQRDQAAGELQL